MKSIRIYEIWYPESEYKTSVKYKTTDLKYAQSLATQLEGWYGSKGTISITFAFEHENEFYELIHDVITDEKAIKEHEIYKLRKNALAKLTEEERKVLGLI